MMQTTTTTAPEQLPANKPYNTRKVSLSLTQLGIHIPNSSRASHSRASLASANKPDAASRPTKRVKRSHTLNSNSPSTPRPSPLARQVSVDAQQSAGPLAVGNTPPPSPGNNSTHKIDTTGINDNIVVAVLEQLQSTGNRPHLIKELAAVLSNSLSVVESSANPAAIVSSRLTNYLRRAWTVLAPCPLAKEQVTTHPRRVYYYLTVTPRQNIPEYVEPLAAGKRIISPSISSGPDEEEAQDARSREIMSPSPEVDLSSHELEFLVEPSGSDHPSAHPGFDRDGIVAKSMDTSHNYRGVTPPLESDEREFTQTASSISISMQQRKDSEQAELQRQEEEKVKQIGGDAPEVVIHEAGIAPLGEETQERADQRNREVADALFGQTHHLLDMATFGSPLLRAEQAPIRAISPLPKRTFASYEVDDMSVDGLGDSFEVWDELQSPENVELDELDNLLGDYK